MHHQWEWTPVFEAPVRPSRSDPRRVSLDPAQRGGGQDIDLFKPTKPTKKPKGIRKIMSSLFGAEPIIEKFKTSDSDTFVPKYSLREPSIEPDDADLPKGYKGAPPPSGWADQRTAQYVPKNLRKIYLELINDAEGEVRRRDEAMLEDDGNSVTVPDPQASTGRSFRTLDLKRNQADRDLAVHLRRLNEAEKRWNAEDPRSPRQATKRMLDKLRTCQCCGTQDLTAVVERTGITGSPRLCAPCSELVFMRIMRQREMEIVEGGRTRQEAVTEFVEKGSL